MNTNPEVVKDVVKGIVLLCRWMYAQLTIKDRPSISLGEVIASYSSHVSNDAQSWIFEFVKDGMKQSLFAYCINEGPAENYKEIWDMTNSYLRNFGFAEHPIESIELD